MKLTARNTHRDIAYFYVGLILSFALSGIALNHRRSWNPTKYTYDKKQITVSVPLTDSINDAYAVAFSKVNGFDDDLRRIGVEENTLNISYVNHTVEIDLNTGQGKIESFIPTPVLSQMVKLHKDTSRWWIYFSDVFGLALFTLGLTGMFIERGRLSFKSRGWKLALLGIAFPLIFLFLLS
ncbi:MAG: PepSY-associated TM helix domain-containing protein [Bacteroidetes bacterium]|nr:PepSY-associated TM helix domain-containing protein [Bacteroidota bacterium]